MIQAELLSSCVDVQNAQRFDVRKKKKKRKERKKEKKRKKKCKIQKNKSTSKVQIEVWLRQPESMITRYTVMVCGCVSGGGVWEIPHTLTSITPLYAKTRERKQSENQF